MNSTANQSQYQSSKVGLQQRNNAGQVPRCEECNDVENDIEQTVLKTEHLKKQNDKLRSQLRIMSKELDGVLDKVKQNRMEKRTASVDPQRKVEQLKLELKSQQKNLKSYKKQHARLQLKIDASYDVEKITALLRVIKNKKHELNELQVENRNLLNLKRDSERVLKKHNPDYILNSLRDEILATKSLIADNIKIQRINEKNFKKQQEYIVKLDLKHKSICEEVDAEYYVDVPTEDQMFSKELREKTKWKPEPEKPKAKRKSVTRKPLYTVKEIELEDDELDLTEKGFKRQHLKIKELKRNILANKNKLNKQKKEYNEIMDSCTIQVDDIKDEIGKKERDIEAARQRIKDLLALIELNGDMNTSQKFYVAKGHGEKSVLKKGKEVRRQFGGVKISSNEARAFNDAQNLPSNKDYKITEVRVIYGDEYILSLEVDYKIIDGSKNGEKKTITCFKNSVDAKNQKVLTLPLKGVEHISQIHGYYTEKFIKYLRIITSRGNFLMAGDEKHKDKLEKFTIDIQKDEKPISFFGTVDKLPRIKKNIGRESEYCLVSLGCELRKKDAYTEKSITQNHSQVDLDLYEEVSDLGKTMSDDNVYGEENNGKFDEEDDDKNYR